jgi:hypothetical protein
MDVHKLTKREVNWMHQHLAREILDNYEFLWVLEGCMNNAASSVWAIGEFPWSAGYVICHRQCHWLRLNNEKFMEPLLDCLPKEPILKFYVDNRVTLEMLTRWYPGGMFSESTLFVRRNSQSWRKRFDLDLIQEEESTLGRRMLFGNQLGPVATITAKAVVKPYVEISEWTLHCEENRWFWLEQAIGLTTGIFMAKGKPMVIRVNQDPLKESLGVLGYREFSPLYYYMAIKDQQI